MTKIIDPAFVDVDFEEQAEQAQRMVGAIPSNDYEYAYSPVYEDSGVPIYSTAEIREHIKRMDELGSWPLRLIKFLHDQDGEPSCVYNAGALGLQTAITKVIGGAKAIKFSAISGYKHNGSPWSGSTVGGCIRWLEGTGLQPSKIDENKWLEQHGVILHPDNGYSIRQHEQWKQTSRLFRADEWMRVTTRNGWYSAIINGHGCVGGRDRHAIWHGELSLDGNSILSIYAQSWGIPWGFSMPTLSGELKSFGADSARKVDVMVGRDAWALRTPLVPQWLIDAAIAL
jgi:hypothetical protein